MPEIAAQYVKGLTQQSIADHLNAQRDYSIAQQTVSKDLAEIRHRWLEAAMLDFAQRKAEELARLDVLEQEAWEAWEGSKAGHRTKTTWRSVTGERVREGKSTRQADSPGDPRFLDLVRWAVDRRIRLMGLDNPEVRINVGVTRVEFDIRGATHQAPGVLVPERLAGLAQQGRELAAEEVAALGAGVPALPADAASPAETGGSG